MEDSARIRRGLGGLSERGFGEETEDSEDSARIRRTRRGFGEDSARTWRIRLGFGEDSEDSAMREKRESPSLVAMRASGALLAMCERSPSRAHRDLESALATPTAAYLELAGRSPRPTA